MNYPSEYGKYILLESIGQGGMSAIDLAQSSVSNAQYVRFLVIKRMHAKFVEDPSFVRMFQDEARINAELQHANIAQVYDFGQVKDEFYIAMEYIPGLDLRELQRALIQQEKTIPLRVTLKIICEILEALNYAHNRVDTYGRNMNIVHRDVNPRNVMLSVRGEIKLIDFGVAKSDTKIEQTVNKTLKGKFAYMSPEQFEGAKLDGRSDLFAIGLMLFEMIENRRPFAKLSEVQIMHRILSGRIPQLSGPKDHPQPELIQDIHRKVLKTDPDERFGNAQQMKEAIIEAAHPIGGIASNQEMAAFLRNVIPGKINTIADRLTQYREEITHNDGISYDTEPFPDDEETLAIPESNPPPPSIVPSSPSGSWVPLVLGSLLLGGVGSWFALRTVPQTEIVEIEPISTTKTLTAKETVSKKPKEKPKEEDSQVETKTATSAPTSTVQTKTRRKPGKALSTKTKNGSTTKVATKTSTKTESKTSTETQSKTSTETVTKTAPATPQEEIFCFIINIPKNLEERKALSLFINGKNQPVQRNLNCYVGENRFKLVNTETGVAKTWSQTIVKKVARSKNITLPPEVLAQP